MYTVVHKKHLGQLTPFAFANVIIWKSWVVHAYGYIYIHLFLYFPTCLKDSTGDH